MSKQIEALKLALEGLEKWHFDKDPRGAADYITAIREALAEQPAQRQEPVAWMYPSDYEKCLISEHVAEVTSIECTSLRTGEKTTIPLYTSPQPSKPMPEDYTVLEQALTRLQKRYAELEGKVRKPLTDEQIERIYETPEIAGSCFENATDKAIALARAIEAAHGIKENT